MNYPTMEEVEKADRTQICRWYRFLESPAWYAVGREDFQEILDREVAVMTRIVERFRELGGMTPEISKLLGWKK
jgi:hypothetical protein